MVGQTKVIGSELNGEVEAALAVSSATRKQSTGLYSRQTVQVPLVRDGR